MFGSRLESNSFSLGERPQLIDFQARETKRPALGGRAITAFSTEVTTEQKQCVVTDKVSSFTSQARRSGSYRPEGWKVEGENLTQFRNSYGCTGHTNKGDY